MKVASQRFLAPFVSLLLLFLWSSHFLPSLGSSSHRLVSWFCSTASRCRIWTGTQRYDELLTNASESLGNEEGPQYVGAQTLSAWIGSAVEKMPVQTTKKPETAELTVAISKCREGFKSLFVAPFALLSACVMSRVVFDFPPTQLDVAIDGADEVDADLTLIKGGGWVQINTDSRTLTVSPLISVSRSSSLCLTAAAWLRRRL